MVTLTADAALLAILRKAKGPAEIRDPDGNFVGFFTPATDENTVIRTEEEKAELRRRASHGGPYAQRDLSANAVDDDGRDGARPSAKADRPDGGGG